MAAKVTADPSTRIFTLTEAPVSNRVTLDMRQDFYSALKDDWFGLVANLDKNKFPMRSFGDPQGSGQIGPYVFLDNLTQGWRVQPYDADHELIIVGNLISESAVAQVIKPLWLSRPGRTITIREVQSAQALTLETGVSGLTSGEAQQLTNIETETERLRKLKGNEMKMDRANGKILILEDNDTDTYQEADAYEDFAKTIPLNPNSTGVDVRERFKTP